MDERPTESRPVEPGLPFDDPGRPFDEPEPTPEPLEEPTHGGSIPDLPNGGPGNGASDPDPEDGDSDGEPHEAVE